MIPGAHDPQVAARPLDLLRQASSAEERLVHARQLARWCHSEHQRYGRPCLPSSEIAKVLQPLATIPAQALDHGDRRQAFAACADMISALHGAQCVPLIVATGGPADSAPAPALEGLPEEDALAIVLAGLAIETIPHPFADEPTAVAYCNAVFAEIPVTRACLALAAARWLLERSLQVPTAEGRHAMRRGLYALIATPLQTAPAAFLLELFGPADPWHRIAVPTIERTAIPSAGTFTTGNWNGWQPAPDLDGKPLTIGGRVSAVRAHRKTTFIEVEHDGRRLQAALPNTLLSGPGLLHTGDLLTVQGQPGLSRTGEPTLFAEVVMAHNPCVLPDPDPTDSEDLRHKALGLQAARGYLQGQNFYEVVTPVITPGYFGGSSRPYATWENASRQTSYLRVTSELALTAAIADGLPRCYEIGASFRNEGLRSQTIKEFLLLEAYAIDQTLDEMVETSCALLLSVLGEAPETTFRRVTFDELFEEQTGVSCNDDNAVKRLAADAGLGSITADTPPMQAARRVFKKVIRPTLQGHIALSAIPGPSSPLIAGDDREAQRVWLYVNGVDLAEVASNETSLTRLNADFAHQFAQEHYAVLRDYRTFMRMLARGLPPCVGVGIGFTRLLQLRAERQMRLGME